MILREGLREHRHELGWYQAMMLGLLSGQFFVLERRRD